MLGACRTCTHKKKTKDSVSSIKTKFQQRFFFFFWSQTLPGVLRRSIRHSDFSLGMQGFFLIMNTTAASQQEVLQVPARKEGSGVVSATLRRLAFPEQRAFRSREQNSCKKSRGLLYRTVLARNKKWWTFKKKSCILVSSCRESG